MHIHSNIERQREKHTGTVPPDVETVDDSPIMTASDPSAVTPIAPSPKPRTKPWERNLSGGGGGLSLSGIGGGGQASCNGTMGTPAAASGVAASVPAAGVAAATTPAATNSVSDLLRESAPTGEGETQSTRERGLMTPAGLRHGMAPHGGMRQIVAHPTDTARHAPMRPLVSNGHHSNQISNAHASPAAATPVVPSLPLPPPAARAGVASGVGSGGGGGEVQGGGGRAVAGGAQGAGGQHATSAAVRGGGAGLPVAASPFEPTPLGGGEGDGVLGGGAGGGETAPGAGGLEGRLEAFVLHDTTLAPSLAPSPPSANSLVPPSFAQEGGGGGE